MFKIIKYNHKYKEDMLSCYLLAKDALGGNLQIREDLLDIQKHYFDKNDMFWIAIGDDNRTIGMVGTNTVYETDMWLKRLFIKPAMKRKGIGTALLAVAEKYAQTKGITKIHTRFNDNCVEALYFYPSQGFVETKRSDGLRHFVKIKGDIKL